MSQVSAYRTENRTLLAQYDEWLRALSVLPGEGPLRVAATMRDRADGGGRGLELGGARSLAAAGLQFAAAGARRGL